MSDMFAIYLAQKPYQDENLGAGWRTHRFLMLANEAKGVFLAHNGSYYMPEQELHYVWEKGTPFLKAAVYPKGIVARPKFQITLSQPLETGSEYDIRGAWNRALATGVALNKENLRFADFKEVSEVEALNTCDAGVQAGLDAMGIIHDFGRSGLFNVDLFERVAAQVPAINPLETLHGRREASLALMRQVNATRKMVA